MISLNLEENLKFVISSINTLTTHSNKEINSLKNFILFYFLRSLQSYYWTIQFKTHLFS